MIALLEANIALVRQQEVETLVVHVLDPQCFCSVYSGNTIDKLSRQTSSDSVHHVVLVPPGQTPDLHRLLPILKNAEVVELDEAGYRASMTLIPATPAALVYNKKTGSISYLGPHSSGVVCGKGTGFVDLVLNNLQHGFDPLLYELEQKGCFCSWGD